MSTYTAEIARLESEAESIPYGPVKLALFEDAVRLADVAHDEPESYRLRLLAVDAAGFSCRPDVAIVHFSWCLAYYDRLPDGLDPELLLLVYNWIVTLMICFDSISLKQIFAAYEDLSRRFKAFGDPHAIQTTGRHLMLWLGRFEEAMEYDRRIAVVEQGSLTYCCKACSFARRLIFLCTMNRWDEALAHYHSKFAPDTLCRFEPYQSFTYMLRVFVETGEMEEARRCHRRSIRFVEQSDSYVDLRALHIEYLVLTNQTAAAKRLVVQYLEPALIGVGPQDRFEFLSCSYLCLESLRHEGEKTLKIALAKPLDVAATSKGYEVGALAEWMLTGAKHTAAAFDRRSGNTFYADRLGRRLNDLKRAKSGDAIQPPDV